MHLYWFEHKHLITRHAIVAKNEERARELLRVCEIDLAIDDFTLAGISERIGQVEGDLADIGEVPMIVYANPES